MKKLVFLFLLLAAQVATAQEPERRAYVFGMIGSAKVDIDKAADDAALRGAGAANLSSTVNDTAAAGMIGMGYKFIPQASIEVAYLKASDFTYDARFTQGTANATFSGSGIGFNVVGYLPLGDKVNAYGKLGIWSFTVDATATVSAAGFAQAKDSSTNTTPMIGVGVEFKVAPQVGLRVEYDHFDKVGNDDTIGSSKLDFLSAGIAVSF